MRKHLLKKSVAVVALSVLMPLIANAQSIEINETNFPDTKFRKLLLEQTYGSDGVITEEEISEITSLSVVYENIKDLTGIEYFTALEDLYCDRNNLTSLDVSKNTKLMSLSCANNKLTSLNVSGCAELLSLYCSDNRLTSLDVSGCTELQYLYCCNNLIKKENMDALIKGLRLPTNETIYPFDFYVYSGDKDAEGNVCTPAQVEAAKEKNWIPYTSEREEYAGNTEEMIDIDEENFPDENFRNWLFLQSYGKNGLITEDELKVITTIDIWSNQKISNLKGIEYFTALTQLNCSYHLLTSLDVSQNTALTELRCTSNQLTTLDISKNTALKVLWCNGNQLTNLDVSKNAELTDLYCDGNLLADLDVSTNHNLSILSCDNNSLTTLDLSGNTVLKSLYCTNNQLENLDISSNTVLESLNCSNNQLKNLDISGNTALRSLNCSNNQLENWDISGNTALRSLNCSGNPMTDLDVSRCTSLGDLTCTNSPLKSLNASGCTSLNFITCPDNQLTSLDISGCTSLQDVACYNNQLKNIDATDCTSLRMIYCDHNAIKGKATSEFINSLPQGQGWNALFFYNNLDSNERNVCTKAQVAVARSKGWTVFYGVEYDENYWNITWVPYEGSENVITIDEDNFPDANFRNHLLQQSYGSDGVLTEDEIKRITQIDARNKNISSLQGIEYFTELTNLDCSLNQLTTLDVSNNTALTGIYCYSNQIKGELMDNLISSLPQNYIGESRALVIYHVGNDGNVCTKMQVAAAKAKGWTSYYTDGTIFEIYEGYSEETDGIDKVYTGNDGMNVIHTLDGKKLRMNVSDLPKGIYIVNGKKVAIK